MQLITPSIKLHTTHQDQGTHLNCLVIEHQGNNYHLPGCTGTTIHTFTESICLYVLRINRALQTVGLFAFMAPEPDCINSVILHSPGEIRETLGTNWERLSPMTIITKLIDYLI